jgi:hypothetical protein
LCKLLSWKALASCMPVYPFHAVMLLFITDWI